MNQTRILSLVSVAVAILCFLSSCKADFVGNSYKINNNWYMDFSVLNETERKKFPCSAETKYLWILPLRTARLK